MVQWLDSAQDLLAPSVVSTTTSGAQTLTLSSLSPPSNAVAGALMITAMSSTGDQLDVDVDDVHVTLSQVSPH